MFFYYFIFDIILNSEHAFPNKKVVAKYEKVMLLYIFLCYTKNVK